jgi:hypothetical protein
LAKEEIRYTKFNIHTQSKDGKKFKASYANYTNPGEGHVVIAAGTEILIIKKTKKVLPLHMTMPLKRWLMNFTISEWR